MQQLTVLDVLELLVKQARAGYVDGLLLSIIRPSDREWPEDMPMGDTFLIGDRKRLQKRVRYLKKRLNMR